MKFKKSFLSYISMCLGALTFSALIFMLFTSFFEYVNFTGYLFGTVKIAHLSSAGVILMLFGIYALCSFVGFKLKKDSKAPEGAAKALKAFKVLSILIVFAFGVYVCFFSVSWHSKDLLSSGLAGFKEKYLVGEVFGFDVLIYGLSSFIFNVFGESAFVYLVSSSVLYFVTGLFLYFSVKAVFGDLSAFVGTGAFFLLAFFENDQIFFFAENFTLLCAAFLILIIALLLRARHDGLMISGFNALIFLVMGLCFGVFSSFFPCFFVLIIAVVFIMFADKIDYSSLEEEYENPAGFAINKPWLPTIFFVFFAIVGLFGTFLFNSIAFGDDFISSLNAFFEKTFAFPGYDLNGLISVFDSVFPFSLGIIAASILVCVFALFAFLHGFKANSDVSTLPFVLFASAVFVMLWNSQSVNSLRLVSLVLAVLAAKGIASLVIFERKEKIHISDETADSLSDDAENDVLIISEDDFVAPEPAPETTVEKEPEQIDTNETTEENASEQAAQVETSSEKEVEHADTTEVTKENASELKASEQVAPTEAASESTTESATESAPAAEPVKEPAKVKLFDNPLPLPKKHVKKEISYDFDVSDDMMKYDVSVSDDDDFDI